MRTSEIICNINTKDTTNKQVIYASQLYGTFFSVSAILKIREETTGEKYLDSVDLYLLNYKGNLNIGILRQETIDDFECDGVDMKITLHLKANINSHGLHPSKCTSIPCANFKVDDLETLLTTRELHRMNDNIADVYQNLEHGVFDSEYFRRDGIAIENQADVDDVKGIGNLAPYVDINTSGRCKDTFSKFI